MLQSVGLRIVRRPSIESRKYLSMPLVLVPPEPGRPLLLYLAVLDGSFGCILGQHDETGRKEQAIYYLSNKFTPYEARYSLLERTCCVLTWVAQKLRHYFCTYTTYLISRMDPLKYIIHNLAKWQILLGEFDIVCVTLKAVKVQALEDHLADNPVGREYEPFKTYFTKEEVLFIGEYIAKSYDGWRMFFNGAANFKGAGVGAVLVSETNQHYPWHEKLLFVLLGYCTTVRTSTGATLYLLVYGTEVVIPAEVEIPSLRIIQESKLSDSEWMRSHYEKLVLIDGKRMNAKLGQNFEEDPQIPKQVQPITPCTAVRDANPSNRVEF
ncbi:PREDICTED: uncharacterized protein LOC109213935 [Nicotiana attenuata]|uniref:uncharacterized protein LOC109213935 n=1 Tax=Nicotiana attenuata TaxID=49451 RepID=UPI000904AB43|nr:PREDICTED: uncharacterized protein LOC109213935 [Nicotiana attenuata]